MVDWENLTPWGWAAAERDDWDEEALMYLAAAVAKQVGLINPSLATASDSHHDIDFRGRLQGYPARIMMSEVGSAELQVKCPCDYFVYVSLDMKRVPKDDFSTGDDLFEITDRLTVPKDARHHYRSLPQVVRDELEVGMAIHALQMVAFDEDDGIVGTTALPPNKLTDPVNELATAWRFVGKLAQAMNQR